MNPFRLQALEPVDWSRSQGNLEDEENQPVYESPILILSKKLSGSIFKTATMIVGGYGAASNFLFHSFPEKILIGILTLPEIPFKSCNKDFTPSVDDSICYIYHVPKENLVLVQCQYKILDQRCSIWTSTLFSQFSCENVIVLDTLLESEFKNESIEFPLVRVLSTFKNDSFLQLETPNVVHGIGSSVLEFCQISDIKCSLYISLVSNRKIERETYSGFEQVFSKVFNMKFDSKKTYQEGVISHHIYL